MSDSNNYNTNQETTTNKKSFAFLNKNKKSTNESIYIIKFSILYQSNEIIIFNLKYR